MAFSDMLKEQNINSDKTICAMWRLDQNLPVKQKPSIVPVESQFSQQKQTFSSFLPPKLLLPICTRQRDDEAAALATTQNRSGPLRRAAFSAKSFFSLSESFLYIHVASLRLGEESEPFAESIGKLELRKAALRCLF